MQASSDSGWGTGFASTDMKEQRKKLLGALALEIRNLRKPEVLTSALKDLGQRHRNEHWKSHIHLQ